MYLAVAQAVGRRRHQLRGAHHRLGGHHDLRLAAEDGHRRVVRVRRQPHLPEGGTVITTLSFMFHTWSPHR